MTDDDIPDGTNEAHPALDPAWDTELRDVLTQLAAHGITLEVSDTGTILVQGYDGTPDQAALLVANRALLNSRIDYIAATTAATDPPAPAPVPPPFPEERQARRALHRAALAASREPLPGPPIDLPTSGAGVVLGPATDPAWVTAERAREYREDLARSGGRRIVRVIEARTTPRYDEMPP
jgi:hypothetical protein